MLRIVGIGELMWDVYSPVEKFPGGVPANCAIHTCQLGHQGILISRVGSDSAGEELISQLAKRNVETNFIQSDPQHPTAEVSLKIGIDGTPDFACRQKTRAFNFLENDLKWALIKPDAIVFTVLGQINPVAGTAIQNFLKSEKSAFKLLDANAYFLSERTIDILRQSLLLADGVKLNQAEFEKLGKALANYSGKHPGTIPELMREFDLKLVLLTLGNQGARIFTREQEIKIAALNSTPHDTNGCGDAFAAAALILFLLKRPIEEIARSASQLSAFVANSNGAVPVYQINDREFKKL